MKSSKRTTFCLLILLLPVLIYAQKEKENLGDKEYIIVKDYKPVLGESFKISDSPKGDTSSTNPPVMKYNIRSQRAVADYEAATIKAVKIKDEALAKLYKSYIKLGIGNYTTYAGDLYVNALRSKKGAVGLALNHYSGNPGLKNAGSAGFSQNHGGLYGKYFIDNSTFSGNFDFNRDVVHYYGYDPSDTIFDKSKSKQRFNKFGLQLAMESNYLNRDHLDYKVGFGYSTMNDLYDVSENDFLVSTKFGKKVDDYYLNGDLSLNFFKKSLAKNELLRLDNDLSRNIVSFTPTISFTKEKINLVLGLNVSLEKNVSSSVHLFPDVNLRLPIAENILYAFVGVNGSLKKNSYQTVVADNPFVTSEILLKNTVNKLDLKGGLNGNFSNLISFVAMVKYTTFEDMLLYINDSVYFNKFNAFYAAGNVLDLHAELSYKSSEDLTIAFRFDQYSYSMDPGVKPWHKPNTEMALNAKYNLWDKFILNAGVYGSGKYSVRVYDDPGYITKVVSGYVDLNLGIEYRYSKILSVFVNLNNLGFSRYYRYYNYPSERFNVLGGLTYSF